MRVCACACGGEREGEGDSRGRCGMHAGVRLMSERDRQTQTHMRPNDEHTLHEWVTVSFHHTRHAYFSALTSSPRSET